MSTSKSLLTYCLIAMLLANLGQNLLADDDDDEEEDDETITSLTNPDHGGSEDEEMTSSLTLSAERDDSSTEEFKLGLGGWIELRPSWTITRPTFHTENELALQWGLQKNLAVGYTQEFSNHYLPLEVRREGEEPDSKFRLSSGYVWAEQKNLARGTYWTLNYAPRVYFPTAEWERTARLQVATQQYLKLNVHLTEETDYFFTEAPLFAIYENAGFEGPQGPQANRSVENRMETGLNSTFLDGKITLKLPLILQNIHYNNYHLEAINNAQWVHLLTFYPEVMGQISDNFAVGLAYYTDSLIDEEMKKFDFKNAFRNGVMQVVLQAAL